MVDISTVNPNVVLEGQNGRKVVFVTTAGRGASTTSTQTIEVKGLRRIECVVSANISGGYMIQAADTTIAANKITVQPYYWDFSQTAPATATAVPSSVDLSSQTIDATVIGY